MKSMIFFDLDGTLWDENLKIPDSAKLAIQKLQAKGHMAFVCTGRARGNLRSPDLLTIPFDGMVCGCGSHIEVGGHILFEVLLPGELLEKAIHVLKKYRMPMVLEGPWDHWIDDTGFDGDTYVEGLFRQMGESAHYVYEFEPGMRVNKISCAIKPDTDYDSVVRELGDDFDFILHPGHVAELVPKGCSKASGIARLCEHFSVDRDHTYGLGDSTNDLEMLKFVGHGIAMGNGQPCAKEAAEYVTAALKDGGVYKAMEHYRLI